MRSHIPRQRKWRSYSWPFLLVLFVGLGLLNFFVGRSALVPYASGEIELQERYAAPGSIGVDGRVHWMGADGLGRDVWAGIVEGFLAAGGLAIGTILISMLLGLWMGCLGGWYGDRWRITHRVFWTLLWIVLSALYMGAYGAMWSSLTPWLLSLFMCLSGGLGVWLLIGLGFRQKEINLPLDSMLMRWYEIFRAIPALLLLLLLTAMVDISSRWMLMGVMVFFIWPSFGRFVRGEVMRVREEPWLLAGRISGLSFGRLVRRHLWPAIAPKVLVMAVYAMGAVIILEASLEFLGILTSDGRLGWGHMMYAGRENIQAWWLTVFPGVAIFLLLAMLHSLRRWVMTREMSA